MAQRELSRAEIEALLARQRIVRVGFAGSDGGRYLLPLGYAWDGGALCLMLTRGRKTRLAEEDPRVAFQVDDSAETGPVGWSSVTGEGTLTFVTAEEQQEAGRIRRLVTARFPELSAWAARETERKQAAGDLLYARLTPTQMTGRTFQPTAG